MICKMKTHYLWLSGLMSKNEQINGWKIFPIWTILWAIIIKPFLLIDPRQFTQNQQKSHHTWYPPHMQVHPSRYSSPSEAFCTKKLELNCSLRSWLRCPPAVYTEVSSFSSFTFTQEKKVFFLNEFFPGVDVRQCFLLLQLFSSKWDNQQSWYVYILHFLGSFRSIHFSYPGIKRCSLGFCSSWTGIIFSHHQHHIPQEIKQIKKQKTELYKSYFHQVHSCSVETSKIKKGNKK